MMHLTGPELEAGFAAIERHGYGDFFPEPPELDVLRANWPAVQSELAQEDLDLYPGYHVVRSFAPKSRLNVRRVALLHPYDLVIFTSLIHALKKGITDARLPAAEERVFSYRADRAPEGVLYNEEPNYTDFKNKVSARVYNDPECFVGIEKLCMGT